MMYARLTRSPKAQLYFTVSKLAFMIVVPVVLLILPADFFDHGRSICVSQVFFGVECFACGLTRGIMHLIHLEAEEAFVFNMMSFIVLPVIMMAWIVWFRKEWKLFKRLKSLQPTS